VFLFPLLSLIFIKLFFCKSAKHKRKVLEDTIIETSYKNNLYLFLELIRMQFGLIMWLTYKYFYVVTGERNCERLKIRMMEIKLLK